MIAGVEGSAPVVRSERERFLDILEAIERIEKYAVQGRGAFVDDELIQNWIVHHINISDYWGKWSRSYWSDFRSRNTNRKYS